MCLKVWDDDASDPSPSHFRDAAVLLTPSYNNKGHLVDLGLTVADKQHVPASKTRLAPTLETEAEAKYDGRWAEIKAWALRAARKENSRAASSGRGGHPPLKRPCVMDSTPRVKEPRFASYGRGGPCGSTEDGEGAGSEEQQLTQQVDAEMCHVIFFFGGGVEILPFIVRTCLV